VAEEKGFDGGKKISGIKLHVGVDVLGLPHVLLVTTAEVGDRKGAEEMVKAHASNLRSVDGHAGGRRLYGGEAGWGCVSHDRRGGTDSEAERASQVCGDSETLGGGKEFCLAGQLPQALEELREEA